MFSRPKSTAPASLDALQAEVRSLRTALEALTKAQDEMNKTQQEILTLLKAGGGGGGGAVTKLLAAGASSTGTATAASAASATSATSAAVATKPAGARPKWFCSYAWVNSKSAYSEQEVKEYKGEADPRQAALLLSKTGLHGWLDKEQLGGKGLFDDIADGLLNAKIIVAFISDEYAKSENCMEEFTYAVKVLRIPVIPVIVGTGFDWQKSKLGLLLGDSLYIDMTGVKQQEEFEKKLEEVKHRLTQYIGPEVTEQAYLEKVGQNLDVKTFGVGDAAEMCSDIPLNFSGQFQKIKIKEDNAGAMLMADYWWPVEVVEKKDTGALKVHYWAYGSNWDEWVEPADFTQRLRGLQYPSMSTDNLAPNMKVEIRLLQNPNEGTADNDKAYCWTAGVVDSIADGKAKVKVNLKVSKIANRQDVCPNNFTCSYTGFGNMSGFEYASVTLGNVRILT